MRSLRIGSVDAADFQEVSVSQDIQISPSHIMMIISIILAVTSIVVVQVMIYKIDKVQKEIL
jgi:hypothetical protein